MPGEKTQTLQTKLCEREMLAVTEQQSKWSQVRRATCFLDTKERAAPTEGVRLETESLKVDKAFQGIKSVSKVSDREINRNEKISPALYQVEIQALPLSNIAIERATIFEMRLFLQY